MITVFGSVRSLSAELHESAVAKEPAEKGAQA